MLTLTLTLTLTPTGKREWSRVGMKMQMKTMLDRVMGGIETLKALRHRNVIFLHALFNDPSSDSMYLVLDYCEKRNVMEWASSKRRYESTVFRGGPMGGIDPAAAAYTAYGALCGIEYLHSQGVCHRDIKPDNLLLTGDWCVKIADFGVSCRFRQGEVRCSSPHPSPHRLPKLRFLNLTLT